MMTEYAEKRRSPRRSGTVIAEVRAAGQTYRTQCETTDISNCGCYMKTLFPVAVGTAVDMIIWVEQDKLPVKGVTKTLDPGLGNGIEFVEMSEETRARLHSLLETLEIAEPGEEFTIFRSPGA